MSNDFDPLNELASAHLDGDHEAARDPRAVDDSSFDARVESMRAVSKRLGAELPRPDPALRERHLAAALDLFDQLHDDGIAPVVPGADADVGSAGPASDPVDEAPGGPAPGAAERSAPVVSLEGRRSRRSAGGARNGAGRRLPGWLGAAAALVLVMGGLVAVVRSMGSAGGDDTAAVATDADTEASDGSAEESADESDSVASQLATGEAAGDRARNDSEDAAADEESTDGTEAASDDAAEGSPLSTTAPASSTGGDGVVAYDRTPTQEELEAVTAGPLSPPSESRCGPVTPPPTAGAELIGFVPAEVATAPVEILVYEGADGVRSYALVDADCAPVP